jgi:protein required for attachment to host cells
MATRTWIMAADSSRGRLFEIAEPDRRVREIEDFSNPQGRASNRELVSGADGRFSARHLGRKADSGARRITPVEHETELFSKALARYLEKARSQRRYSKLYLVAPPEFLGLMRENLSKEVRKVTAEEINKHLAWLNARDIARYVQPRRRRA